jgi:serine O-acetyltransferase
VVGVPGHIVSDAVGEGDSERDSLEHGNLPDPEAQAIDDLTRRVAELESMIHSLVDEKVSSKR